jgi:malate synthase
MQIKEKYSMMRWYDNGVPDRVSAKYDEWLDKYENLSMDICFYCGNPAVGTTRGWILSICQECADKRETNIRLFTEKEEELI